MKLVGGWGTDWGAISGVVGAKDSPSKISAVYLILTPANIFPVFPFLTADPAGLIQLRSSTQPSPEPAPLPARPPLAPLLPNTSASSEAVRTILVLPSSKLQAIVRG